MHQEYARKIVRVQQEMMNRYIPCHGDIIDEALANVINNGPECEKMKIMFLRESEGVYRFGSKQIAIKCDRNQPLIRVGGGYLSVKDFLKKYTDQELEKLERREAISKFHEKISIQKIAVDKSKSAHEVIPIQIPQNILDIPQNEDLDVPDIKSRDDTMPQTIESDTLSSKSSGLTRGSKIMTKSQSKSVPYIKIQQSDEMKSESLQETPKPQTMERNTEEEQEKKIDG